MTKQETLKVTVDRLLTDYQLTPLEVGLLFSCVGVILENCLKRNKVQR